jgi:hypothetical protein
MAQSLGVLERVVTAASHSSVSPTTPMFVQARQGVLKASAGDLRSSTHYNYLLIDLE